jgi:hypothetical protein
MTAYRARLNDDVHMANANRTDGRRGVFDSTANSSRSDDLQVRFRSAEQEDGIAAMLHSRDNLGRIEHHTDGPLNDLVTGSQD